MVDGRVKCCSEDMSLGGGFFKFWICGFCGTLPNVITYCLDLYKKVRKVNNILLRSCIVDGISCNRTDFLGRPPPVYIMYF